MTDLYRTLGVTSDASDDQIKKAYRHGKFGSLIYLEDFWKLPIIENWHWNGIQTRTQKIRKRPRRNSKVISRDMSQFFWDHHLEIAEAYEILSDSNKRAIYDREGISGVKNGGGADDFSRGGFHSHHFTDPNEIFRQFFGTGSIFDIMDEMMGAHMGGHSRRYFLFQKVWSLRT